MAAFSERFKRIRGSAKHYRDVVTGEELSYRQARNRAASEGLTRKSHAPERKSKATAGRNRYAAIRKRELQRRGLTEADLKHLSPARQAEINRFIKFQSWRAGPGAHTSFAKKKPTWAEDLPEIADIREEYDAYQAGYAPVGGFLSTNRL